VSIETYAKLLPLLPLIGAVLAGAFGRPLLRGWTPLPVILGVGLSFACSIAIFMSYGGGHQASQVPVPVYSWFATGSRDTFNVEFLIDPLAIIMLLTVTGVALLVVIYSRDYMRHDHHPVRGYERFFAYLGLFVFSMVMLVLGGNFLLLYLGWEAVGLCSYLLIGFYYDKPSAAAAAKKAFLVNRVGDFGFGLGILLIYLTFGSLSYETVFNMVRDGVGGERVPIIALLLFCGAVGKSAQLPLHVWLPDAMEGPSPVSALIHAATMVTAGVYMVARCGVIFTASEGVMTFVAVVGGVTALFAATIALTQHDMKRILAYSTISQLGYMFLGLGVFAADSAVFHLFTHAFFKALLFLGAGSVMHAMGGIIDLREFGGLRKVLPWTYRTVAIGCFALAGFPLLSGFWSKDEIIHAALSRQPVLGVMAIATALLTAFYTFRMFYRCFHGEKRVPPGVHAHESGAWMLIPLVILSVGAIFAGYANARLDPGHGFLGLFAPHGWFAHFLEPSVSAFKAHAGPSQHGGLAQFGLMYLSGALAIIGIVAAYIVYVGRPQIPSRVQAAAPRLHTLLFNKYYIDELYDRVIVRPARAIGRTCYAVDTYAIDGLLWLITAVPRGLALMLRTLQQGALQSYGLAMLAGFAIILLWVLSN